MALLLAGCAASPAPGSPPAPAQPLPAPGSPLASAQPLPAPPARSAPPLSSASWGHFVAPLDLEVESSSTYPGWSASNVLDGNPDTSWFSGTNDSTARGLSPWLLLTANRPLEVRVVVVKGNRNPIYFVGYSVLTGRLTLAGKGGEILYSEALAGQPPFYDFVFKPPRPVDGVQSLRFDVLSDQGARNPYGDVAIGDILVNEGVDGR